MIDKLLPQDLDAEERLLSTVFLDNDCLSDVSRFLRPENFYRTAHQKIFSAILECDQKKLPLDPGTVCGLLADRHQLDGCGSALAVSDLPLTAPVGDPEYLARRILKKSRMRTSIQLHQKAIDRMYESPENPAEVHDETMAALNAVSFNGQDRCAESMSAIILDQIETLEAIAEGKTATGVPSGFAALDRITGGFQAKDLILIAARPSMGKTALASNIARNAASRGHGALFFSLEQGKDELIQRDFAAESGIPITKLRSGRLSTNEWARVHSAAERLSGLPIWIDDTPALHIHELRQRARRHATQHDIGLIIVDYLQLMRGEKSERKDLEVGTISRGLKSLAKELGLPVIALSQLNRSLEQRGDKRPLLSDLRESGALEQDADVVAFIYRDEVYNKDRNNPEKGIAELIIRKHRNGPTGTVRLKWTGHLMRFDSVGDEL